MKQLKLIDIYSNHNGVTCNMLFRQTKRGLSVQMKDNYYMEIDLANTTIEDYFTNNGVKFPKRLYDLTLDEVNTFLKGDTDKIRNSPWWANDGYLVEFYQDLYNQINECFDKLKNNPLSRNIVACNKNCCYSWFNFCDGKLIVHCRSTDAYFGLKSDIIAFMIIAKMVNYNNIFITFDNLHYYLKTDKLARRETEKYDK